ncbi:MAG TPA: winged helix DNA-binding protein [Dongiaceae bacterium]|nr:winged helix DNA-binding protein [Dongiaceae bacterium]
MAGGIASSLLRLRDQRERILPNLGDCAWTMLLILWSEKRKLHVSNLCDGCHAPATTALRHLGSLERKGLVERVPDPDGLRRAHIALTIHALDKLNAYAGAIEPLELAA